MSVNYLTGEPEDGSTFIGGISFDGRFVMFSHGSENLLAPGKDTNGEDVFVRDRLLGVTDRVSVATDGTQAIGSFTEPPWNQCLSSDGRYALFISSPAECVRTGRAHGERAIFVRDRTNGDGTGSTSPPTASAVISSAVSAASALSGDGRTAHLHDPGDANLASTIDNNSIEFDAYVRGLDAADPLGADALFP